MKETECLPCRQHGLYALGNGMALLLRSVRSSGARPHCSRRGEPGAVLPSPGWKMQELRFSFQFSTRVPRSIPPTDANPEPAQLRGRVTASALRSRQDPAPRGSAVRGGVQAGPQQCPLPRAAAPDVRCATRRCSASRGRCRGDVGPHHHSPHHAPKKMLFALLG